MTEPLLRVQYRLTDRDMTLLGWLADHGVLTTGQIAHALFPSLDFAQRRLLALYRYGVVDRFRPQRPDGGTHPFHYLLAQLGVDVIAAQRGHDVQNPDENQRTPTPLPRRDHARRRRWWLTNRARLPHLLAVNQFFTDLAGHARTHPDHTLDRWWSTGRCMTNGAFCDDITDYRANQATIRADGHGIWTRTTDGAITRVPFFAEIDLGTEDLARLVDKNTAYDQFAHLSGHSWPVLYWLHSDTRERNLHRALARHRFTVPIATAARTTANGLSPADPVWRLHRPPGHCHDAAHPDDERDDEPGRRIALIDLVATVTGRPLPPTERTRL